jgi:hypothetical protein
MMCKGSLRKFVAAVEQIKPPVAAASLKASKSWLVRVEGERHSLREHALWAIHCYVWTEITRLEEQYATTRGRIRQIKVLYCSDSCLALSPSRIGKNSKSEITKVRIESARLNPISAWDMLVTKILRGYTGREEPLRSTRLLFVSS